MTVLKLYIYSASKPFDHKSAYSEHISNLQTSHLRVRVKKLTENRS